MKQNQIFKIAITGVLSCLIATTSTFATTYQAPLLDSEKTVSGKDISVSQEEILEQLETAESKVTQEEKEAFEAKWDAMTAQEKHDYLLPFFLDELNSLHTKLIIAESAVNNGETLDMSFLQLYQSELLKFHDKILILSDIKPYEYSAYKPLSKAIDELYSLAGLLDLQSAGLVSYAVSSENDAADSKTDYEKHSQYYMEFYNQANEISLMRQYGIEIDQNLDRMFQEIAIAHKNNLMRYKKALDTVTQCVTLYSKGGTDSKLYRAAKNINRELYVDFNIRDTSDFSAIQIDENDKLTPMAYEVVASLGKVYDVTEDYLVYAMVGTPSRKQDEMDKALSDARSTLKRFEEECNLYLEAGETIDQNIFETIANIKADRHKTAKEKGYDSWEAYQIHLESLEKARHDNRVKEKATELAVVQKEYEDEMRKLEEEAQAEWLRNRVDFSKPLSEQNHTKGYYMEKALADIENNPLLSSFSELSLKVESQAFDKLFKIRANGGDTSLLQDLYDSHPNDFSLILELYHYYK